MSAPTDLAAIAPKLEKFASLPVQNLPEDLEDEFFECVDDHYDLKILEGELKEEKSDQPPMVGKVIRRTASYNNINKIEEASDEGEEEDSEERKHIVPVRTPLFVKKNRS